jgi:hypothetical protein
VVCLTQFQVFQSLPRNGYARAALFCLPLFLGVHFLSAPRAQAEDNAESRYQLCSRFPHNSNCQGYVAPIPLKDRAGLESKCAWETPNGRQSGDCKLAVYQDGLLIYREEGQGLSVLDNRRSTSEIKIPYDQMQNLTYREFTQNNDGKRAMYGALFGAGAAQLAIRDKPMSEVAVQYQLTSGAGEAIAGASTNQISFVLERDKGFSMRSQIESKTNLRIDVPASELPFVEVPAPL